MWIRFNYFVVDSCCMEFGMVEVWIFVLVNRTCGRYVFLEVSNTLSLTGHLSELFIFVINMKSIVTITISYTSCFVKN